MKFRKPNPEQIKQAIRWAMTGSGPIAALLIEKFKVSQTDLNLYMQLALLIVPPLVSFVWSMIDHTDSANVDTASKVDGVKIQVNPVAASPKILEMAMDPTKPNIEVK